MAARRIVARNNWGCAISRAFREVACRAADTIWISPYAARRSDLHPKHIPLVHSHWPGLAQEVVCHYAGGEAGQVEIESQWTARKREQSGIFLTVRKHPAP